MKRINILEAPIFSKYFSEFINSQDEYSVTNEFMKENIFMIGICNCGESHCSTVSLLTKKPLELSKRKIRSNRFNGKFIHLHVNKHYLEFEAIGDIYPYKNEVSKLLH